MHHPVSTKDLLHDRDPHAQATTLVGQERFFKLLVAGLAMLALLGASACSAASGNAGGSPGDDAGGAQTV